MGKILVSFIVSILIVGTIPAYADNGGIDPDSVSAQVIQGSLSNSFTKTLTGGGHVVDGVGLTADGTTTFSITLPAGASVDMALLYWDVMDAQADTVEFESIDVLPGLTTFGTVPDPCWPNTSSTSYRADVTSLVPGTGVYDIEITKAADQNSVLGAALVVIYKDSSAFTVTTILVDDGHIVATTAGTMSHTMSGFTIGGAPIAASTSYIIGDSQVVFSPTDETFETTVVGDASDENAGPRFHTNTADVLADVFAGMTTADLTEEIVKDCLTWIAQVFDFTVQSVVIGGTLVPIDTTALLLAGVQSISMWMIPVVVAGVAIGIFVIKRRK